MLNKKKRCEVNCKCYVNCENVTPCKNNLSVAINIQAVDANENFKNILLAYDDYQQCCEDFSGGFFMLNPQENNIYDVGYVKYDVDYEKEVVNQFNDTLGDFDYYEQFVIGVYDRNDNLLDIGYVKNDKGDYYAHEIIVNENGELIYDGAI